MMRLLAVVVVGAIAIGALPQPGSAERPVLRVYNWPDYIAETTLARFEAETGIAVEYDTFASNESLSEVVTLGTAFYDVVVPTSTFLERQARAGVYQPLNRDLVPNLAGLDPDLVAKAARTGSAHEQGYEHGAIYLWGTNGLGFNRHMVLERLGPDAKTDSWALLFDPANAARLADCGISMLDSGSEVVPVVLAYLGLPPDSTAPAHLAAAESTLAAIQPYLRTFDSETFADGLADGSICLAVGWSGDVIRAREAALAGTAIDYTVPREGTIAWFDMLAIPVDAPNPVAAHAFIDFLLRPDVIADITNAVYYANAVRDALPMVDEVIRQDPAIYPDGVLRPRLFAQPAYDTRATRRISRLWQRFRGG